MELIVDRVLIAALLVMIATAIAYSIRVLYKTWK
jgi:hypothetical protein